MTVAGSSPVGQMGLKTWSEVGTIGTTRPLMICLQAAEHDQIAGMGRAGRWGGGDGSVGGLNVACQVHAASDRPHSKERQRSYFGDGGDGKRG